MGEGIGDAVGAGEAGQQRRVGVDDPAAEPSQEWTPDQLHEAGAHDQIGGVGGAGLGQGPVPGFAIDGAVGVAVVAEPDDERGDASGGGPFERRDRRPVGAHRHDLSGEGARSLGVEESLQQCPRA
jgi:hypothetical protein